MDIASLAGILLALFMLVFGIISSAGVGGFREYLDPASAIITFGGAFSCTLMSMSLQNYIAGLKSFTLIFKAPALNTSEMIGKIIELSNVARKEGLLSLEEAATDLEEPFLKKGILLIVDGTDPELVRAIMETELVSVEGRHKETIGFWDTLAAMGPAWGMIGTLIGLVDMLYNMDDPSTLGPAMAVALITTLYGSLLANWICTPVSNKLKADNAVEMQQKEVMIEGLLSIQAGENPRVIEEKLDATKYSEMAAAMSNSTFSIFNAGSTAIGEGILISNGVSQLNDLDEYISNAGRNADSETDSDNYEKYDSAEALEEALNEKNLESNEELAETVQEALVEDSLADQVSVSFTAQYVQLSMKGALLFDSGSDSLKDQAKAVLDKVGVILERYGSNSTIEIEGHTDNVPIHSARFADNEELSSARALSVFYYLTETTSLDPSDLRHAGMGDRVPVADNSTEEGRSKNRRVEIRIYNPSTTY